MSRQIAIGDYVITVKSLWHEGQDIGDRLGKVIDISSYIVINIIDDYNNNPIKCFKNEVILLESPVS